MSVEKKSRNCNCMVFCRSLDFGVKIQSSDENHRNANFNNSATSSLNFSVIFKKLAKSFLLRSLIKSLQHFLWPCVTILKLFEESFIWLLTHEMAVTVVTKAIKSRWTLQNFNSCFVLNFIRKTQNYKFMLLWNMRKLPFPSNVFEFHSSTLKNKLKKYAISLISYLPHLWFGAWLKTRIQFTVRYPNLILYDPTYPDFIIFAKQFWNGQKLFSCQGRLFWS